MERRTEESLCERGSVCKKEKPGNGNACRNFVKVFGGLDSVSDWSSRS
jgi:hypothetical protein